MTDIVVSFGANTADLNAAFAAVKSQAQAFGGTIKAAADQGGSSFSALTAAVNANTAAIARNADVADRSRTTWLDVAAGVVAGQAAYHALADASSLAWRGIVAANSAVAAIPQVFVTVQNAADSAAKSMLAYAASQAYVAKFTPLVQLANDGLIASFGRGVIAIQNWLRSAEIFRSGLIAVEGEAIAAAGNMGRLQEAARQTGFSDATALLRSYTDQLAQIPGMTNEAAAGIVSQLGAIQNFSGQATLALIDIIPRLSKTSDDAKTLAAQIANAFANPASNGKQFLATLGGVSARLQEQFEEASRTSNVNKQQAVLYDALIAKVKLLGAEKTRETQETLAALATMGPLGNLLTLGIRGEVNEAMRFNAELDKTIDTLQREADAIRNMPQSSTQVFQAAQPIIANARPQIDQIEEITQKLKVLYEERQRLQTGGSPFGGLATPGTTRELERNKEATDALEDSLRKLQDQRKGGSAVELLENAQAQARSKFTLDESAAARALAAAYDQEAASTKNLAEAYRFKRLADEERKKADEADASVAEATWKRRAAAAETGSAEELAATLRANAAKRAVTPPGAARIALDAADEAADRAHQAVLDADAKAGEDARFRIKQEGLSGAALLIREEAQEGKIGHEKERADLLANLAAQEAAQREHYAKIKEIYGQGTSQFREAQKHLEEIAAESGLKRVAIERQIDQQIAASQKQMIDQTASTFSQAISGMIAGQTSLRDAAKQIAAQVLQTYIQLGLKMVLANSGATGQMVAQVVTGEAAKTAATTAGVSARTGAEATGSVAASASTISAVLKSIFASAAETFAGIFGFLSPVLGPAAAGPAAAGEATVLAVAGSLAMGAWELPRDMLVQAHRGEMVVPAGVTPWMQGAISGAAGTPGVNTVHVHHVTNFNVSAMDSQSVQQFFKNNGKAVMRAINESVRTGSHIGLSKLGPA